MNARRIAMLGATAAAVLLAAPAIATAQDHVVAVDESTPLAPTFTPDAIAAASGETVRWDFNATANDGEPPIFPHDVEIEDSEGSPVADSPIYAYDPTEEAVLPLPGYFEHTFTEPGTYSFVCTLHPATMTGEVVVAPPATTTRLEVAPKSKRVKAGRKAALTATARNTGDAAATGVRVCARAPRRLAKITGKACRPLADLAPGAEAKSRFKITPKKRAKSKKVRVRFTLNAANAPRRTAIATLKVPKR